MVIGFEIPRKALQCPKENIASLLQREKDAKRNTGDFTRDRVTRQPHLAGAACAVVLYHECETIGRNIPPTFGDSLLQ